MQLFVLGATGGIGRALVTQAVARGHRVTALVRSSGKLGGSAPGVTVVEGDPRNTAQLGSAMPGSEVVISTLGPPIPFTGKTTIMGDAADATVRAMHAAGLRRLLVISGDLQFADGGPPWLVRATLLRHLSKDQAELERVTQASELDWTIVRPTRLTNGEGAGTYRTADGSMPPRARAISRSDVAQFLLDACESGEHLRRIVGLAR